MISGYVSVYLTDQLRKRSRFVRAGLYLGLTIFLLGLVFGEVAPEDITAHVTSPASLELVADSIGDAVQALLDD